MISLLLAIIYLSFISLGLPDSLLGSGWPVMHQELAVSNSWSGIIFMIISACTVVSALLSERLTKKFGAGLVTAVSVAMTAVSLIGFSVSGNFWLLCVWSIPYGLGAGSVDAALNNFVAIHYAARHMSWLHCMWGVGTMISPMVMSHALSSGAGWQQGYGTIGIIQFVLVAVLFATLPIWKKVEAIKDGKENTEVIQLKVEAVAEERKSALSIKEIFAIPGAAYAMITFFCYCALEQTASLWASTYFVQVRDIDTVTAAKLASMFFIGITVGRAVNGFLSIKFSDSQLIHLGELLVLVGVVTVFLPLPNVVGILGFIVIGLGCAPVYPCMIHATPEAFGAENSQAVIGVQMAAAYIGITLMPPLFGVLANATTFDILPIWLFVILALMAYAYERVRKTTKKA